MRSPPPLSELLTRAIQEVESTELKLTDLFHISPTYVVFQVGEYRSSQVARSDTESLSLCGHRLAIVPHRAVATIATLSTEHLNVDFTRQGSDLGSNSDMTDAYTC